MLDGGRTHAGDSSDWDRFVIRGVKLGMHLKDLNDFKSCTYPERWPKSDHPFFLITDERCKNPDNRCELVFAGSCGPRYNGGYIAGSNSPDPPFEYVKVLASTQTDDPRVYSIDYFFHRQVLSDDSPFGKQLVAKYGPRAPTGYQPSNPDDPQGDGYMTFNTKNGVTLDVNCGELVSMSSPRVVACHMFIRDRSILDVDLARQKEIDRKRMPPPNNPPVTL
jgi:hypothetical protein